METLKLYGFNNLTKTLSFNIYDICYAEKETSKQEYIEYIDEQYNSERLTKILSDVAHMIGASILNIARQDYEPQGASVTILVSEGELEEDQLDISCNDGVIKESVVGHLDKSHITVHTYPESHPDQGISTFRVDIEVSTCGEISPLKALNFLIDSFDSDIINLDFKVRGFTRDINGNKHFNDHKITSIQNYIADKTLSQYNVIDVNVYQENIFHSKMILKDLNIEHYLFDVKPNDFSVEKRKEIEERLHNEMLEIYYGRNMPK